MSLFAAGLAPDVRATGDAPALFPTSYYRDYSRCWPAWLRSLAHETWDRRNRELAALRRREDVRRRQNWVRETFWKLIGGMPERTPLNAKVIGGFERRAYRVEKLLYESRPGVYVSANLYIPRGAKPPLPGVLFQMGHALNGKASGPYQRCCQALAQLGYLVLAFDPMGQGERVHYPDASGYRTRLASADDEHTVPGRQMLLVGDTATRWQVWDAVRSLDLLATHPLVDPRRLGSTGQSGGGTLTMFLACVDDRLAAAAVASGNTENFACQDFNPPGSTDDAEQNLLGSGPLGLDRWDLLYPLAPKPLLVSVSEKDFFGTYSSNYLTSGRDEFEKLKRVYEILGAPDRLVWTSTPLPHGLAYDTRLKIYNWFERWLKGENRTIEDEPPTEPEPDRELWVSVSGSVVRDYRSRTPFEITREQARKLPRSRPTREALARLLALDRPPQAPEFRELAKTRLRGLDVQAVEVASSPHVWVPAWIFVPHQAASPSRILLILDPAGRNARWREGDLYQSLALKGHIVCAADVRGIGDLTPEFARGAPHYARSHADEESWSWASLILGRPLLGQRVTDILATVAALTQYSITRARAICIAARGHLGVPALCAAALESRIEKLYLAGSLLAFREVVETENYRCSFANFVPGMLREADLPEIAELVAPRRILLAGAVDGEGRRASAERVRAYWRAAHVEVRGEEGWEEGALSNFIGL